MSKLSMKTFALIALALCGCYDRPDIPAPKSDYDQCLRAELFQQCLRLAPAGPVSSHYNDWAEVISECQSAASRNSVRAIEQIKPECLALL